MSLAFVLLTIVAGLSVWPRLPAEMAVHFSASGTPDNHVSRAAGVLLLPAIMLLLLLVFNWAARVDPPRDMQSFSVVTGATVALLAAVQGIVLAWNLGYSFPFELAVGGIMLWVILIASYAVLTDLNAATD